MKTAHVVSPNNYLKSSLIGLLIILGLTGLTRIILKFFKKSSSPNDQADIGEGFGLE